VDVAAGLSRVRERIAAACSRSGRDPASVRLVAVSKTWPASDVLLLHSLGQRDFGESYAQEAAAKASKEAAQARFSKPIVTEIAEAPAFWSAEDYHQRYLEKRGLASCAITVSN